MFSNTWSSQSRISSDSYYMNDSGVLTKACPFYPRPDFEYENGKYVLNGYLDEQSATNSCPSSNYLDWYQSLLNYSNPNNSYSIEEVQMLGPTNDMMPVYKVVVNYSGKDEMKIPVSYSLQREQQNPTWSFFIKKDSSITTSTLCGLGIPGQSLELFDLNILDWTNLYDDISQNGLSYGWNLYAGREQYCNGWVRIGLGGYCSAGGAVYNAAFDPTNTSKLECIFYICLPCAVQNEPKANYMSSYIDPQQTRTTI